jgi:hypothetical protein
VKKVDFQPEADVLKFDSNFECSNCDFVRKINRGEYHVFMRSDSNGSGSLQWFAFRMKNTADFTGTVKIVICNFTKTNSLF